MEQAFTVFQLKEHIQDVAYVIDVILPVGI